MQNLKRRGQLLIISGPSGVGKGTIRELVMADKSLNLFYSISMTTRNIRPGEVDGKDYYFVSKEEFKKNIDDGNLLEWAVYVNNFYGTPKDKVEAMLEEGKNVVLEIDTKGAATVSEKIDYANLIFIAPPSVEALIERLKNRGTESEESIQNRIHEAMRELEQEGSYRYIVINDKLEVAVEEVKEIIRNIIKE